LIRKKYPSASLIHKYKGYDVWVPELDESVEVKYDPMSNKTGNIVVEIEMFGKPSGLMSTTADYWVFHDDIDFVIMKPMYIVNCIFLNKLKFVEFVGTGDTAPKKAFLVPKQLLFSHGKKIEE
jgi:hypothetical protein